MDHVEDFETQETMQRMTTNLRDQRVELKPLNRFERELVQKIIDKEHPLKDTPI